MRLELLSFEYRDSKTVCTTCAIGPILTESEPPHHYINQENQTLFVDLSHA